MLLSDNKTSTSGRKAGMSAVKWIILRIVVQILRLVLRPKIAGSAELFYLLEKHGFHLTNVHFYSPIPNTAALGDHLWSRPSSLWGIEMNRIEQLGLLATVQKRFKSEYDRFPLTESADGSTIFWISNGMFVSVDAEMLYAMVRLLRPKRMIEVGCGFSTLISEAAVQANFQDDPAYACDFLTIDPYPPTWLKSKSNGVSRCLSKPIQAVDTQMVETLQSNDILFIDSSHVATIGSDVTWEILELLPKLRPGVFVHFHDIFMPYEYPKEWIKQSTYFWNEQYLLQAFLAYNREFEVIWAGHYMHRNTPERLTSAFRSYDPAVTKPASLWLRRI